MSGSVRRVDLLEIGSDVLVRPMAEGCLAVAGDNAPLVFGSLHEHVLAVCARPTERAELMELLSELPDTEPQQVDKAIDDLLVAGVLRPT